MAQLAIKGHPTRGGEVIEILEMLGGVNAYNLCGDENYTYYTIDSNKEIKGGIYIFGYEQLCHFTLEEFEKLYPYKVGDKISSKYLKNYKIEKMEWEDTNNKIIYKLQGMGWYNTNELQPYKEQDNNMKENEDLKQYGTATIKYIQEDGSKDVELIIPYNQEIVIENGRYILRDKKPKYPKTYVECCTYLGLQHCGLTIDLPFNYSPLFISCAQLYICRNAYWKIAGKGMGLDKPWKPDWCSELDLNYTIIYNGMYINKIDGTGRYALLAFPTKEMRDAFYENFKELIEECKELL